MSTVKIIVRCDHEDCINKTDILGPGLSGWKRKYTEVFARLVTAHDYCPEHAGLYPVAKDEATP